MVIPHSAAQTTIFTCSPKADMSQTSSESDTQDRGREGESTYNLGFFFSLQPLWTVVVPMRSMLAKGWICVLWWNFSHWRRSSGEMMWKRLVASAPAGAGRKFGQNCSESSARACSGCAGSLTRWEKPALSSSLEECFWAMKALRNAFFFLMLLLFPRRLPWVYKWLHFPSAWQLQLHLFSCEPGVRSG